MRQSQWEAPSKILNYDTLNNYKWVSDFLSLTKLERELREVRREKDRVATLLLSREDYFKRIKLSHNAIEKRRQEGLVGILAEYRQYDDPCQFFQQRIRDPVNHWMDPIPSLDEFKRAVDALPEGKISAKDREKQLATLEKKIVSLDSKLKKLRSDETVKLAKTFVQRWRHAQRQICSACNPFGISLDQCSQRERSAWKDLGIDKYLSETAPYLAHPGQQKGSQELKKTKSMGKKSSILSEGIRLSRAKDEKPGQGYIAANG
ncbi:MAG: hypothetical protein ISR61_04415 [Desulfobacteraceae bacterium]|nr:hypothetical protein [Desulfobacteraceae bacterium]MBL7217407.1 hypothetical protein [Desulfobacteraceae bacterium]